MQFIFSFLEAQKILYCMIKFSKSDKSCENEESCETDNFCETKNLDTENR